MNCVFFALSIQTLLIYWMIIYTMSCYGGSSLLNLSHVILVVFSLSLAFGWIWWINKSVFGACQSLGSVIFFADIETTFEVRQIGVILCHWMDWNHFLFWMQLCISYFNRKWIWLDALQIQTVSRHYVILMNFKNIVRISERPTVFNRNHFHCQ